eukprot:bmy_01264T0
MYFDEATLAALEPPELKKSRSLNQLCPRHARLLFDNDFFPYGFASVPHDSRFNGLDFAELMGFSIMRRKAQEVTIGERDAEGEGMDEGRRVHEGGEEDKHHRRMVPKLSDVSHLWDKNQ